MATPAGYTQSPSGFYFYTDGSGPYAIASDGTPYLVSGSGGGGGGAGDASAANQATQITAANTTNTKLDTLTAKVPAALGSTTSAGSLSVTPASDATFTLSSTGHNSRIAVVRPANVTPYTANDVVGGVYAFTSMGLSAGNVIITSANLRYDVAAIPTGMTTFRLYLYNVTPPSALADNTAWDLPSGDRQAYLGYIDLGSIADLGSTLYTQVDGINKQCKLGAGETTIYAYLVTIGGYTPAANSESVTVTLSAVGV